MKRKLDENMPAGLVASLSALGHDADTVPQEQLADRDDDTIWNAAQGADRVLITTDLDFSDVRRFHPGTHHGLILVRLHKPGRRALAQRVEQVVRTEDVEGWRRCFVVVTDTKIRIRRP
jgi:predicted nuclease of predicted toxin-antitoxin system